MIPLVVANELGKAQILNLITCNGCSNCSFVVQILRCCCKDKFDGNQLSERVRIP